MKWAAETYQSIIIGLEQTNKMIDAGYLRCNKDFQISVTEKYLEHSSNIKAVGNTVFLVGEIQPLAFSGVTKVEWYW